MANFDRIALLAASALTLVAVLAAWFDLRERRIPNLLVFPATLIGLILNASHGWDGLWFSTKGFALGIALLFIPYLLRVMGAGDVKLLASTGAFVGASDVMRVLLLALLAYPVLALGFLIHQRKLKLTLVRFGQLLLRLLGIFFPPLKLYAAQLEAMDNPQIASATSPFGVAISIGTLLALYTQLLK